MTTPVTIATHNGAFHADDVFGVAVLLALHPYAKLIRTRNPELIAEADYAVDVGGVWDPARGRFDHHQKGFEGQRANGTVYASAGLVWAARGRQLVLKLHPELADSVADKVHAAIDSQLVEHLDRADTGADPGAPDYFGLSALVDTYNPTRQEDDATRAWGDTPEERQERADTARIMLFHGAMQMVGTVLTRLTKKFVGQFLDEELVRDAARLNAGRVLLLEKPSLAWEPVVIGEMPDVQFVVYPDSSDQQFQVRTVPVAVGSFKARKDLPTPWAGLRDESLAQACGVSDAVFCHNARFIAGARTQAGALKMATLALEAT